MLWHECSCGTKIPMLKFELHDDIRKWTFRRCLGHKQWALINEIKVLKKGLRQLLCHIHRVYVCVCVQSLSPVWLFVSPWTEVCQASLSFTVSWSLLKFLSIELVMPDNHLILCCPLLLLLSVIPSESSLHIRTSHWSFSLSISSSNEYSVLISFRIYWFDLLAVQGTFNSILQHHSLKTNSLAFSLLHGPALTLIHDYWKNIALNTDLCLQSDVFAF